MVFAASHAFSCFFGALSFSLGVSGGRSGTFLEIWGDFWGHLGRSWGTWGTLGGTWGPVGALGGTLGPLFGSLGGSWGVLEDFWGSFGEVLGGFGGFWVTFGEKETVSLKFQKVFAKGWRNRKAWQWLARFA